MHEYMHKHMIFLRKLPQWVIRKKIQPNPHQIRTQPDQLTSFVG